MSDRDFMNLDQDLLDDGIDAAPDAWDDELLEDFPDDDPAAKDAPVAATGTAANGNKTPKAKASRRRRRQVHGGSVLCFFLALAGGLTLAAGVLMATGAAPEALLDFSGFADPAQIGDFAKHPVNAFWLAAAVTLITAMVSGLAVDRRLRNLIAQTERDAALIEAVRELDPEQSECWQREELQADPDLAASTSSLLGHFNLQQAKLTRYVGLEGELHRLEKALADETSDQLEGNWESPAAGSLADQGMRLIKARDEVQQRLTTNLKALENQGPDVVSGLRDAHTWNASTLEQLNQQGAAVESLARQLAKLSEDIETDENQALQRERLHQALVAVQQELADTPDPASGEESEHSGNLGAMVERASRLAFQIAMEVARLGAKGERLLPLTQDLEELTTELRRTSDTSGSAADSEHPRDRMLENIRGRLVELDPTVLEGVDSSSVAEALQTAAPQVSQTAANLVNLSQNFPQQSSRIEDMLRLVGDLAGIEIGVLGDQEVPAVSGMEVDTFDPFAAGGEPDTGLVADPFASSGSSIFDGEAPGDSDFTQTTLPGQEELPQEPEPEEATTPPPLVTETPLTETPVPETLVTESAATLAPEPVPEPVLESPGVPELTAAVDSTVEALSRDEEKVYDLSEFDAQLLPSEPSADTHDEVYDLSAFDAVKVG